MDQSQSPIFLRDPQDRALVTVNGSHLDFKCTESNLGKSIKSTSGVGDGSGGGEKNRFFSCPSPLEL